MLDCTADASVDVAGASASTTIHVPVPSSCSISAVPTEVIASHLHVKVIARASVFVKATSKSNTSSQLNHHAKTSPSFVGLAGFSTCCQSRIS